MMKHALALATSGLFNDAVSISGYTVSKRSWPELRYYPSISLEQWYSTFFVRVPPHIISLQLCTPKVVGA
jgi:hypothetical protein